jgi:hypothetical protein
MLAWKLPKFPQFHSCCIHKPAQPTMPVRQKPQADCRSVAGQNQQLVPHHQRGRHQTAISHHLAISNKRARAKNATSAGNSPDIIQRHYKGLVKPSDAKEFWAIAPASLETAMNSGTSERTV